MHFMPTYIMWFYSLTFLYGEGEEYKIKKFFKKNFQIIY